MGRIIQKNLTGLLGSVEDSVVIADWNRMHAVVRISPRVVIAPVPKGRI